MKTAVLLFSVAILLVCSAAMSGSEVAYFSFTPQDRAALSDDSQKSRLIKSILDKPRQLLATILTVNNAVNISIVLISTYIVDLSADFGGDTVAEFFVNVIAITFVILLFGEVLPKVYATRHSRQIASLMAAPMNFLLWFTYPVTFILMNSTTFIEKRVKWKGRRVSQAELHQVLELTSESQLKNEDQRILEGIVKFGNTDVKQIMVSRVDVVAAEMTMKFDELLGMVRKHRYSRMPVYEDGIDRISGTLYIKDILPYLEEGPSFKWQKLIRKPFFVPENKKIDDLLKEFQEKKIHLAVVVDEYGGASGIVTLDDVLSEVVGDISEDIRIEENFIRIDDRNYLFDGKTPLIDFYRILNVDKEIFEEAKGESDTLAGFIIEIVGRIPRKHEKFDFGNCQFTIESASLKRIEEIKVTLTDVKA